MTVETGSLAAAAIPAGGGAVLLYAAPAGWHARLWGIDLQTNGVAGVVSVILFRPSTGVAVTLVASPGLVANELVHDQAVRGLDSLDEIYGFCPAGTGAAFWLSGTEYSP